MSKQQLSVIRARLKWVKECRAYGRHNARSKGLQRGATFLRKVSQNIVNWTLQVVYRRFNGFLINKYFDCYLANVEQWIMSCKLITLNRLFRSLNRNWAGVYSVQQRQHSTCWTAKEKKQFITMSNKSKHCSPLGNQEMFNAVKTSLN